jgi:CIC family chloride channel protein
MRRRWRPTLKLQRALDRLRFRLSAAEALIGLCALGLASGLLAAGVILAFRASVEGMQALLIPGGHDDFESLEGWARVVLPVLGGLAVGAYLHWFAGADGRTGVVYVMERTVYHQGYLPLRNAITQFVSAAIAIGSGHSVGREGPAIHLGASAGSQLGQYLRLPNNSLRTLVACGTAAAIAASFNTPLAGVAFTMEVVVMEYTIAGFLPVLVAAVGATALMQTFHGSAPAFSVPSLTLHGPAELPLILVTGVLIGVLAAAFNFGLTRLTREFGARPILLRTALAGAGMGLIGFLVPETMGIGYDTVGRTLAGEPALSLLLTIAVAKLIATTWVLGLGIPAGLIGPTLVIGAAAGGAIGHLGALLVPAADLSPAFYALLGMGAMMGASLRAPLAALTAMLELSANPNVILPGMLAIVAATLTTSEGFRIESIFVSWLREQGLDPNRNALIQAFSRLGIVRLMDRRLSVMPRRAERSALERRLREDPRWILIEDTDDERRALALLPVTDVLRYMEDSEPEEVVDLLAIPAQRLQPAAIDIRASLREALELLRRERAEALYVVQTTAPGIRRYHGVITRRDLENQTFG